MAKKLATCTMMLYTDGHTSSYVVMRGNMRGRAFDAHNAEIIGQYTLKDTQPDYRAMTAALATPEAPAVYWQR